MFAPAPKEVSSLYNPINFANSMGEDPITSSEAKDLFAKKDRTNIFTSPQTFSANLTVASSIEQTNASATSALKNLTVVGNCVLPVFTSPSLTAINTNINTKLNASNPVLTNGCLVVPSGASGGVYVSTDTANKDTGLYVRLLQTVSSLALFIMGGTNNRFEWRKETTTLMNLDGNANLNVVGNITGPTIAALTARLAALEAIRPSTAGYLLTWGNSSTQRRQSYPIVSSSAFYAPLVSSNTAIINQGFYCILYEGDQYTGGITHLDNTLGTAPLIFNTVLHRTYRAIEVFYKGEVINLPNAPL
jgi:hypothetical protein